MPGILRVERTSPVHASNVRRIYAHRRENLRHLDVPERQICGYKMLNADYTATLWYNAQMNHQSSGATVSQYLSMQCRSGCGACCIAPSISSPIPGMVHGKPAGVRCVQLTDDNRCLLFGLPDRPAICVQLRANVEMCGAEKQDALIYLTWLEKETAPQG